MLKTKSKRNNVKSLSIALIVFMMIIAEPAFAGLDKINDFVDLILDSLSAIALAVVTIAFMWAGFKFLYQHAAMKEVGTILLGGLLIGGAAELASYFLA